MSQGKVQSGKLEVYKYEDNFLWNKKIIMANVKISDGNGNGQHDCNNSSNFSLEKVKQITGWFSVGYNN
jgi:hypothetical protein